MDRKNNTAIILAGGKGIRLGGDIPKQFMEVSGRRIIEYSLEAMIESGYFDSLVAVVDEAWRTVFVESFERTLKSVNRAHEKSDREALALHIAPPGRNRQESIFNALKVVAGDARGDEEHTVFIHDAARPNLTCGIIEKCYEALSGNDGVMPALPMKDTVYLSNDGRTIGGLLDRSKVLKGQAPELFRFEPYYAANERLAGSEEILKINGSTEPAVLAGMKVAVIPGDESNYKITTGADMERFRAEKER